VVEAEYLTSDALVAPAGVVASHLLDQRRHDGVEWRAAGLIRKRPMLGDQPTMPRQDRGRGDQPVYPRCVRQALDQRREQGSIGPVQPRCRVALAEDRVFVTQNKDLHLQTCVTSTEQGQPANDPAEGAVEQAQRHAPDRA
jgi:hypothetical protein